MIQSPFMTAMCSNSKIRGGVDTGYKSFRALAWLNTDNERCGFATKFKPGMTFDNYIKTLLEVPMIYIIRDGKYINIDGKINFKNFMQSGYNGYYPKIKDFELHANMFFPEVRLRNYIEIRNHDCVGEKYIYSLLSFYKGIFYNPDAMKETEELLKKFSYNDIAEFRYNAPRFGLDTKIKGYVIKDITKELLKIGENSLKLNNDEDVEFIYPIIELNSKNLTPADINICVTNR